MKKIILYLATDILMLMECATDCPNHEKNLWEGVRGIIRKNVLL
jgi:hypothetical protein